MEFVPTPINAIVIEPELICDDRGFFLETYHRQRFDKAGIVDTFVQENHSRSRQHVLRGLHAQRRRPQGKLIRVVEGVIYDVAVDLRPGSSTFGQWYGVALSAENQRQFYIPSGYAHGFCVISPWASVTYRCTDFYDPDDEVGIRWNDPTLHIAWPVDKPILSQKDARLPFLKECSII